MRSFLEKNTTFLFHSILLAFAMLSGLGVVLGAGYFTLPLGLFSISLLIGLTLFTSFHMRGRILGGILCLIVLMLTILVVGPANLLPFAREYYVWMFGTPTENMLWLQIYELFQVCWITAGAFCLQRLAERFVFLRYTAAGAGLTWVLWDMFTKQKLPHLCVVCSLTYVVLTYVFWTEAHWQKRKTADNRSYLLWLLPYMLVFLLLFSITPAPKKPYDWALFKGAYESLREAFLTLTYNWNIGNQEDFDHAAVGFSEEGKLSGNIMDANQEIMEIQTSASLKTNIYLSGKLYDTFLGTGWTQTNTYTIDDRTLDSLETLYAVWRFDKYNSYDYLHPANLTIRYKLFRTGYLFAPLKTWNITGGKAAYTPLGGNLVLQKRGGYGMAYNLEYLQINLQNALFYELLEAPLLEDTEVWGAVQRKYCKNNTRYTLDELETHRKAVYEVYAATPNLSPKVEAYLEEITKDAVTDLDKLLAIEAALSGLTYTTTPGELPADIASEADFLDYFLLESRQGYCSHFATAFVLLARAEGIPARYVEGFCTPAKKEALITVYGRNAHSWPEAYIDKVGWIPFEPTPGYGQIRYTPWRESTPGAISGVVPTPAPTTPPPTATPAPTRTPAPTMAPAPTQTPVATDIPLSKAVLTIIILMLAILFTGLLLVTERYLRKRRYEQGSLEQRLLMEIRRNLQLLALLGCRRTANETLQEFHDRAGEVLNVTLSSYGETQPIQSDDLPALHFLQLYEEILYGKVPVTVDMLGLVRKECGELLELLQKINRFAYLWYKLSM